MLKPFNMSNQLNWFVTNRKDLLRQCSSLLLIPSVFYYYLGGVKKVDSTFASVTQLMDARKKQWSKELLKKLGIPPEIMPAMRTEITHNPHLHVFILSLLEGKLCVETAFCILLKESQRG